MSLILQLTKRFLIKNLNIGHPIKPTNITNLSKFLSSHSNDRRNNVENKEMNLDDEERFNLVNKNPDSNVNDTNTSSSGGDEFLKRLGQGIYHGIVYPTETTLSELIVNGKQYKDLPIVHIKTTKNNTMITLTDSRGRILYHTSAGIVGFKNAKRGTTTAAQAAAIAMSDHIKRRGLKDLRVITKGIGNGRLVSIKSLQAASLNIISITENTPIPLPYLKPMRPPTRRRV